MLIFKTNRQPPIERDQVWKLIGYVACAALAHVATIRSIATYQARTAQLIRLPLRPGVDGQDLAQAAVELHEIFLQ